MSQPDWRPMVVQLASRLVIDQALTPAQTVDFGVATADHYRALRAAVVAAMFQIGPANTYRALDTALGHGALVTAFVVLFASDWPHIVFDIPEIAPPERRWSAVVDIGTFSGNVAEQVAKAVFLYLDQTSAANMTVTLTDEQSGEVIQVDLSAMELADLEGD